MISLEPGRRSSSCSSVEELGAALAPRRDPLPGMQMKRLSCEHTASWSSGICSFASRTRHMPGRLAKCSMLQMSRRRCHT